MCLIIAGVFSFLAFSFYQDGSIINAVINGLIAVFFIALLIRNILKMKAERKKGNSD
jgi:large-conductance mechanosensitive channel